MRRRQWILHKFHVSPEHSIAPTKKLFIVDVHKRTINNQTLEETLEVSSDV